MNKYILTVAALLFGVLSLGAQEYEVLKNINGDFWPKAGKY